MNSYFTCTTMPVKVNGVLIENAQVVTGVRTGTSAVGNEQLIPVKYIGLEVYGKVYISEIDEFVDIDKED